MLRKLPTPATGVALSVRGRRACWALAVLDAGVTAWMSAAGSWFDQASPLTRVATLGGHHVLVLCVAVAAVLMLLATAVLTVNFTAVGRTAGALLAAAVGLSVVALGGFASLALVAVGVVLLVAVLGRAFVR